MSGPKMDFEDELRRALRPQDPGLEFTAAVMQAVKADSSPRSRAPAYRGGFTPSMRMSVAIAASLIAAIAVTRWDRHLHEQTRRGHEAREQAMEALLVASRNLNIVHRVVRDSEGS